jgi:radical SAM superfamily enzyme
MKYGARLKFGIIIFNHCTHIVLPGALEVSPAIVIQRLCGSGSKDPHVLAFWAHYQWQL